MMTLTRGRVASSVLCLILAACGGSSSSGGSGGGAAALPSNVTISASPRADVGTAATFSSSVPPADGLSFVWDFGDGTTASGATATHTYMGTGTFQVNLTITQADGTRLGSTLLVHAGHYANVASLLCT